ncbi:MAG: Ig-like domain-containing protein [Kiritimatiellales bacterium]
MRTGKSIWVSLVAAGLLSAASAQTTVFTDTFENGVPSDSDNTSGFWTPILPETSTVSENGTLVQTASSDSTGYIRASVFSPLSTNLNFFDRQLKFSADLDVSGSSSTFAVNRGQFLITSVATNGIAAPDMLMVGLSSRDVALNTFALNRKIDAPSVDPDNATDVIGRVPVTCGSAYWIDHFDLTLNASRYRLRAFNAGKGSGILRYTGEHGVSRAQWGANGDSALVLETYRKISEAGAVSTSVWDNVKVETDTSALLSEPGMNFQATYRYSYPSGTSVTKDYTLWVPSTESVIRGVIFFGPGTGTDYRYMVYDLAAQEAARTLGFALIGYENEGNMNLWSDNPVYIQPAVQAVLDAAAAVSGHAEISNAPLCITGNSAGAFDSCYLAMNWPERVIAFVAHRGYASDPALSEATKKVPGLMVAGSIDSNDITKPYQMQSSFLTWRSQGAQVAFAVDWGIGHTPYGNQGWEGTFTWFVEVANLRYPRPRVPSLESGVGSPELIDLADDSGWLGERPEFHEPNNTPSVTSSFTDIEPYTDYGGSLTNASWLPNGTCARMYRALTSTDLSPRTVVPLQSPLRITSPAQFAYATTNGVPVVIDLDPREFDDINAIVEVQFYDGATLLGIDTAGSDWSYTFTPTNTGLYTLSLVAIDAVGNQSSAFRTLHVVPADFPPVAFSQAHTFSGDNNLSGTVTGEDPEGDAVTFALANAPLYGQLLEFDVSTGSFTYQPDGEYVGADSFTFTPVSGGVTGTAANVSFDVTPSAVAGYWRHEESDAGEGSVIVKTTNIVSAGIADGAGENGAVYSTNVPGPAIYDPLSGTTRLNRFSMNASASNAGIQVSDFADLGFGDDGDKSFTVEFFEKMHSEPILSPVVSSNERSYDVQVEMGSSATYFGKAISRIYDPETDVKQAYGDYVYVDTAGATGNPADYTTTNPKTEGDGINDDDSWHHIAMVYDDLTKTLTTYTDYQPSAVDAGSILNSSPTNLFYGKTIPDPFGLLIDEVRYTKGVLGASQFLRAVSLSSKESWREEHFGTIQNSGNASDLSDPDGDLIKNLMEYAFDLNPLIDSRGLLPMPYLIGSDAVLQFTGSSGVTGIVYGAEYSTNLITGSWLPVSDTGSNTAHLFMKAIPDETPLYLRLRVSDE